MQIQASGHGQVLARVPPSVAVPAAAPAEPPPLATALTAVHNVYGLEGAHRAVRTAMAPAAVAPPAARLPQPSYAEGREAAVTLMADARDRTAYVRRMLLNTALAREVDYWVPAFSPRIVDKLSALGVRHLQIAHCLQQHPGDADLQKCARKLQAAVVDIGLWGGTISNKELLKENNFYHHDIKRIGLALKPANWIIWVADQLLAIPAQQRRAQGLPSVTEQRSAELWRRPRWPCTLL